MLFYNAHEEYRFYQRKQNIRLCLNQKAEAESICYRPQYTVRKLRNLVLNRHGSLSIRTRIALAAVLSQCEFDTHENALIPVLFTRNKELIPIYKQFEKNWGKFNFEVSFIQDDDYEDLAPRYNINFMSGEWTDIWVGGVTLCDDEEVR